MRTKELRRMILIGFTDWLMVISLIVAFILFGMSRSHAVDRGQYAQVDPQTKLWFEKMKDKNGTPCCSFADGFKKAVLEWGTIPGGYKVVIEGKWYDIPNRANRDDVTDNPTGQAVVWYSVNEKTGLANRDIDGNPTIYCFVPGPMG